MLTKLFQRDLAASKFKEFHAIGLQKIAYHRILDAKVGSLWHNPVFLQHHLKTQVS